MKLLGKMFIAACCVASLLPGLAAAQNFKAPIRIVVPYAAGGGTDVVARLLQPGLSKELGQNVTIDNKPGAGGQVGTQLVASAPADGTTLLFTPDQALTSLYLTQPGVRYDALTDFTPLGQAYRTYWMLSIPASAPYKDFRDYAAAVKRDPLLRSYGVPLAGGAMALIGEAIGKSLGVEMVSVPYNGSAPVIQNVMGGQVPAGVTGMPEALAVARSGKATVIAVSGSERTPLLPETPTFKEMGVPGLEFYTFIGFFGPKGFPAAMAQEFNAALRKTLADPAVSDKIRQMSLQPTPSTLDEAASELRTMTLFWKTALAPKR